MVSGRNKYATGFYELAVLADYSGCEECEVKFTMLSSCFRSIFARIALLIWLIVIVDQLLRHQIILSPNEVVENYMAFLPKETANLKHMTQRDRVRYIQEKCSSYNKSTNGVDLKKDREIFFHLNTVKVLSQDVLLCIPQRMASKSAFDALNNLLGSPCPKGKLKNCAIQQKDYAEYNSSLKIVFTRHPLDRLILEYRHSKPRQNLKSAGNRKLLFARHRNIKGKQKSRKGSHQFREFIMNSVLGPNTTINPISQVSC